MQGSTRGFTLIELLLAIALVVILGVIASVSYTQTINHMRVNTIAHQLTSTMQYAQLTAMTHQYQTILVPYHLDDWSSGWKLFNVDQSSGEQHFLSEFSNSHKNIHIQLAAFPDAKKLHWQADGLLQQYNGRFTITAADIQKQLIINKAGRIRYAG